MNYLLSILTLVQSSMLIEYKFWKNYGKVVYDYSGNGRHGLNGYSISSNAYEGIFTDRGIYLSQSALFRIPPNEVNSIGFLLPNKYTIVFWTYSLETVGNSRLYCRYRDDMFIVFDKYNDNLMPNVILNYSPYISYQGASGSADSWHDCT